MLNKRNLQLLIAVITLALSGCLKDNGLQFTVSNSNNFDVHKAEVAIDVSNIELPYNFTVKTSDGTEIPYQLDDLNRDGKTDELFFQLDMASNSSTVLTISESKEPTTYPFKTDITLKVRDKKDPDNMQVSNDFKPVRSYSEPFDLKQDNGLIFLEGPGWESNLVGYRFYFDDRNRFDIFGKSTEQMSLSKITENYHERRTWGADILKVSSSFGIGSPGIFKNGSPHLIEQTGTRSAEILADGPLRSILKVNYPDWTFDGETVQGEMIIEIHANHRYTELTLKTNKDNANFITGLVKHPNINTIIKNSTKDYSYGYTWGNQTDLEEILGMALILPGSSNPKYEGDVLNSYAFSMNINKPEVTYRFLAAWELEPENVRINSPEEFENYIQAVAQQWQSPLTVTKK